MTATDHWIDSLQLLRNDPRVADVSVLTDGCSEGPALVVLPDEAWLRADIADATAAPRRALRGWQTIYDLAYHNQDDGPKPNFASWISSFTRDQMPRAVMEDWLAATVRRLRELACGRILEIGCGTGLIVEALAPLCQEYRATDLSGTAVRRLRTWLDTREDLRHVEAIHAAAHDVGSEWSADLIILNSVIQYFPDSEYLGSILDNAWNCLRPGGHIFIGDVRLITPLASFISAVEMARSPDTRDVATLRRAVHRAWLAQSELVVDPGFFHRFAAARDATVTTRLKSGRVASEMTRYRYDVVIGKSKTGRPDLSYLAPLELETLPELRSWLTSPGDRPAILRNISNRRLLRDIDTHRLIRESASDATVGSIRRTLDERGPLSDDTFDPTDIEDLATSNKVKCLILAPPGAVDGRYDAWFGRSEYHAAPDIVAGSSVEASQPSLFSALRRFGAGLLERASGVSAMPNIPSSVLPVARAARLDRPLCEFINFSL